MKVCEQEMSQIILQMLVLTLVIFVGAIIHYTHLLPEDADKIFSTLVIYITNPALILHSVLSNELGITKIQTLQYLGIGFLFYIVLIVVAKLFGKLPLGGSISKKHLEAMLVFTNMGFMGLPVVQAVYGDGGIFYIALMGIPFNILVYSYGVYLLAKQGETFSVLRIINPSIIVAIGVLALYFLEVPVPEVIMDTAELLGDVTVPLALLVIGFNLAKEPLKEILCDANTYVFVLIKLLIYPLIIWGIFRTFIADKNFLGVLAIIAAMPVGSNVAMLHSQYGDENGGGRIAKCTVLSTIGSVISIPLIVAFLL